MAKVYKGDIVNSVVELNLDDEAAGGGNGGTVQGTDATYDIQAANEGATAGNARGENSVDLQTARSLATQIAGGSSSTVSGGDSNTASGYSSTIGGGNSNDATNTYSTVGGGNSNDASGNSSTIGGGNSNDATGTYSTVSGGTNNLSGPGSYSTIGGGSNNDAFGGYSTISGGNSNDASGTYATIGGGNYNEASGTYATIGGGYKAKADKFGQQAYSAGQFASQGDAQTSLMVVRNQTNDATQTELCLNGSFLPGERMTIADDTTWFFEINLVARRTDVNDESAIYKFEGAIDRNTGAASTTLVGTVAKTVYSEDTPAWDATVEADTTNGALVIKVTGESPKVINWVARVETTEVTG